MAWKTVTFEKIGGAATYRLGDFKVPGVMDDGFSWWFAQENGDYIATIASSGAQDQYYTWDPYENSWFECNEDIEIDYDAPANEIEIDPSTSFIIFTQYGVEMNIPSAIK